ncbi:MAG: HlyD family efflux transporter periplasmic adaptor subunit [Leptothrix sp. (in: b-proteobacteria)]
MTETDPRGATWQRARLNQLGVRPGTARVGLSLALLGLALVGCGPQRSASHDASPSASASPYIALARGRIDAADGLRRVGLLRAGRVVRWAVEVGDAVQAGQLLAVLDDRDARAALTQAQTDLATAQAQYEAARDRLPALRQQVDRLRAAVEAGVASGQQADDAQSAWADAQAQARVQAAVLTAARVRVDQTRHELAAWQVTSPVAGEVLQRGAQVGEALDAATPLALLLPHGAPVVRAELPEVLADRVRVGMAAEVVSNADETVVQRARVRRIAPVFGPSRLADASAGEIPNDPRSIDCVLELDGATTMASASASAAIASTPPWRVGQRVLVRFLK